MPTIHALRIPESLPADRFAGLLESVDPERRGRILRFRFREDALRCLFGGLLIRAVLVRKTGARHCDLVFSRDAGGKPICLIPGGIHFNLSHSGRWVLAAFDDDPIGIDVERLKPLSSGVVEMVLSPSEIEGMKSLFGEERTAGFYEIWTLKESWLKATGRGISAPLSDYTVISGGGPFRYRIQNGRVMDHAYLSLLPGLEPDYRAAVCLSRDEPPPRIGFESADGLAETFLEGSR